MELLINATIPSPLRFSRISTAKQKPVKARAVCCLRENGEGDGDANGLFRASSQMDLHCRLEGLDSKEISQELFGSSNIGSEMKQNNIWRHFREAQKNILYLNKQRLMALEELNKTKREKQLLVDKIEQLEVKTQAITRKDTLPICWELLFRIDSMVLSGTIGTGEATDMRRLIIDSKVSISDVFSEIPQKRDSEILEELHHLAKNKKNGFHIVHICTEMEPMVSVGSLASYVTGLSRALQRKGNLVEVILPNYASLELDEVQGLRETETEFYSYFNGQLHGNRIFTGVLYGIGVTFIQPLYYSSFFSRNRVYGYSDDFERFTYFSRASLDYIVKSGKKPDVLHIHNWETAIVGPLFWDIFVNQGLESTRILLTCHDIDSQCLVQHDKLALCGLDPPRLHRPDRFQDNIKTHLVNILKGGIVYANKVIMVSSMRNIHSLSNGLESTLEIHKDKLLISPFGFVTSTWDPSVDKLLPENYTADDMKGKAVCKITLQRHLGLSEHASTVIVGCIFSEVSAVDLKNLKVIVRMCSRRGVQFIFMGVSKILSVNMALESFQDDIKDENAICLNKYDEALSHLIFAGSDIILCQSFHDPLLQVPLKAIKYGAAPIAVTFSDNKCRDGVDHELESTNFSQHISTFFGNMSLSQALEEIKNNRPQWNQRIVDAMARGLSWDAECCDLHTSAYTSLKNL